MSTDLHAQLDAAVRARLEVARAFRDACGGSHGWCGDECEEFQRDNDAEAVIRMCEAHLEIVAMFTAAKSTPRRRASDMPTGLGLRAQLASLAPRSPRPYEPRG